MVRSTLDVFRSEGYYKNGKKDGLWTYWYPEGQKSSEAHYKDGVENGVTTLYLPKVTPTKTRKSNRKIEIV